MMRKKFCNRCVMDTTASEIIFMNMAVIIEEFKNLLTKNKKTKKKFREFFNKKK